MLDKFAADISALDKISAMEKKIECVNSRIRDVALLRREVASLRKPVSLFLNAEKTGFHRNRTESSSSSQGISGSKKRKAEEFVREPTQRKLINYLVTTWKHLACRNLCVHRASFGITSCSKLKAMIFWSCKTCSTTFAAEI